MSRVLSALRQALSVVDLYAENSRLRRELAARELTCHSLLANSEQYCAGLTEGGQQGTAMTGRLLAAAREFIDAYRNPGEVDADTYIARWAEFQEATDQLETQLYGEDVDEDEDEDLGFL